jgi:2-oxoacid:acceptor oxidoreductase gamma subunit (pyruvate/2-ketoisovalerate family)
MIEIRIHGRGGQGAVVASQILAEAAFRDGLSVQAFPSFGSERRGAPVTAFVRLDRTVILVRTEVYRPNGLIVLDQSLITQKLVDVTAGLRADGWILINSPQPPESFDTLAAYTVGTVDATRIAVEHELGTRTSPIVNTAILGAAAALTGLVSVANLAAAIRANVPVKPDANVAAAEAAAVALRILEPAARRP